MRKPDGMFDRDFEWATLIDFSTDSMPGATLGIVSGRRRQGKTLLLQELCTATGGFYFTATEATAAESLRLLAHAHAEYAGLSLPLAISSWDDAVDLLLDLGADRDRSVPVVIDEFPYLCQAHPALPSIIQKALAPRSRHRMNSRCRLILCGSAITFMGRLLSGSAPLRGRAGLDLTVHTFDPRTAAAFWGVTDWTLALRLHAVVGGTPAYRAEYVRGDVPASRADFDRWVIQRVLNPSSPLHKEARHLLAEEGSIRDPGLYHSVLAAIAEGNTTRGSISSYVGRPVDALSHPLTVLEDAGLVVRENDALRRARSRFRITEPLIAFYHAVMRPEWSHLQAPDAGAGVWEHRQETFTRKVLGPHFEQLCRWWTATQAATATLGGRAAQVASGVINDPAGKATHELDVVAKDAEGRILCLGEAKVGTVLNTSQLDRLRRARELLGRAGHDVTQCRLLCFSGAGFSPSMQAAAAGRDDVVLVDLERLYTGD